ncbi:MAG: protein tyrosine phosphatase [Gammaproteobacteria bacterium]|nr:protein tyrosine phosphatase [Gammaproteobacteria bacterium]
MKNILIVCLGNICRSPMGEGLLKQFAIDNSLPLQVSSAGITAMVGHPADPKAIEIMKKRDIDISQHAPTQLTQELLRQMDLVLVMEEWQKKEIGCLFPSSYGKVHRLGKWGNFEIPDPYRKPIEQFEASCQLIEQGLRDWQERLWSKHV